MCLAINARAVEFAKLDNKGGERGEKSDGRATTAKVKRGHKTAEKISTGEQRESELSKKRGKDTER